MLAPSIAKNSLMFKVAVNAKSAAANPQYQNSALNPALHLAGRPAEAMCGQRVGTKRGTALR